MEEWMQYARDMAKAEKELEIELWVIISFYRTTEQGGKVPVSYTHLTLPTKLEV